MSQFITGLKSFRTPPKGLPKGHEINDRACELQDAFKSSVSKNDISAQEFISLLHKAGTRPVGNIPSIGSLPLPRNVFEELLQSKGPAKPHPNGISSLTSAFLNIANLSLRPSQSNSTPANSPRFDLHPLYGEQTSGTDALRIKEGYGMLSPDCFYDDRCILLPNATAVLLILFNRNHNYIARRLFLQKEGSTENLKDPEKRNRQDDEIFLQARQINCGHFRNIMLEDVLKPLMGLSAVGPGSSIDFLSVPEGGVALGNGVENNYVEASLLYDSSDIMSQGDVLQVKKAIQSIVDENEVGVDEISPGDFGRAFEKHLLQINPNRCKRDYAGLPRGEDGYFKDHDLARILHNATECPARSTGNGLMSDQRVQQINTIAWARELRACSFVDYRKSLGLKVPKTFDEWTSNHELAETAKRLYGQIENLELYVGLQLEDIISTGSNDSGFRFGYTKTYGLAVDIVSRIRNDPALTKDFTSQKISSWGIQDCVPRRENGSFGASLPRLLQRALPREYSYNSIYGLFPFSTPTHATELLKGLGDLSKYDTQRPRLRKIQHLTTKEAISKVFNAPESYPNPYSDILESITGGYGYFLGFDDHAKHDQDRAMSLHAFIPDRRALRRYADSFAMMANELIREKTTEGGQIDVARDVINAVCIRWISETLLEYPLKMDKTGDEAIGSDLNKSGPDLFQRFIRDPIWKWLQTSKVVEIIVSELKKGLHQGQTDRQYTVEELSDNFSSIYAFVFQNYNQEDGWALRETALGTSKALSDHILSKIASMIDEGTQPGCVSDTLDSTKDAILNILREFTMGIKLQEQSAQTFLSTVVNASNSIPPRQGPADKDRICANILGLAVVASVKYAKICTQAVSFYLQEEYAEERKKIVELSMKDDIKSRTLLMGYIREAYRLDHPLGLWRRSKTSSEADPVKKEANGHSGHGVEQADLIFADFDQALRGVYSDKVDPEREKIRELQGFGLHRCPGFGFVDETMPEIFKAIFKLENLRRSEGNRGKLLRFNAHHDVSSPTLFIKPESATEASDTNGSARFKLSPYPQTLVLEYDLKKSPVNGKAQIETKTISQKRKKWKIIQGEGTEKMRNIMDRILLVILILLFYSMIYNLLWFIISLFSARPVKTPSASVPAPPPAPSTTPTDRCPHPHTIINPWEIITMRAGEDGKLIPIEYTLDLPTNHHLSFVDVDEKDMRMNLVLDGVSMGLSTEVQLNKSESCGDKYGECLDRKFSAGDVDWMPAGKHTVRIEWAGVETPGPDGKVDWGETQGRRLAWMRVQCGA